MRIKHNNTVVCRCALTQRCHIMNGAVDDLKMMTVALQINAILGKIPQFQTFNSEIGIAASIASANSAHMSFLNVFTGNYLLLFSGMLLPVKYVMCSESQMFG